MLGLPTRVLVALLIAPSLATADTKAPQPVKGTLLPGVVVEEVGNAALRLWDDRVPPSSCAKCYPSGAAEKAGIKPGDILLSWERGANPPANPHAARGDFQSPFDVREAEIEQSPRGRMTLVVRRADETLRVEVAPGEWGVSTTPRFTPTSLKMFLDGKRLIESRDIDAGVGLWENLARQRSTSGEHVEACYLLLKAAKALHDAQKWDSSQALYDRAVAEAAFSRDSIAQCQALHEKGQALFFEVSGTRTQFSRAIAMFRREIELRNELGAESLAMADALATLSVSTWTIDEVDASIALARRALAIQERLAPDSLAVAAGRRTLVRIIANGDLRESEEQARAAYSAFERLDPDSRGLAETLNTLAYVELTRGNLKAAESHLLRVLSVSEHLGKPQNLEVKAMSNLGSVALARGDLGMADNYYWRVLTICSKLSPSNLCVAMTCLNLAKVALARGDIDAAEDHARRALRVDEQLDQTKVKLAQSLGYMGDVARTRKEWSEAEGFYRRALVILEEKLPESLSVAQALLNLGFVAEGQGDWAGAATFLKKSLGIRETLAPGSVIVADTLYEIAVLAQDRGEDAVAERRYRAALAIDEVLAPGSMHSADTLHSLGMLERKQGKLKSSERELRRSVKALDSQSRMLGGPQESRTTFASRFHDYYQDYIDTLLLLKKDSLAFAALERSRANSLLAMLAERDLVFASDISDELSAERRRSDADYERAQGELAALNQQHDTARIEELQRRLREIRRIRSDVEEKIKKASPKYASLRFPQPLDLPGTQAALDPGTLLLSYSIGREKSFLFVVSLDPKRGPPLSVFTLSAGEKALRKSVEAFRRLIEWNKESPDLLSRSRSLYETLLKPAEPLIARSDRLLILPDGPLHTLLWAALARGVKGGRPQYLVEWKPLHTAVSATVYAELRKSRRENRQPQSYEMVAFGDPKYPRFVRDAAVVRRGAGTEGGEEAPEDLEQDPNIRAAMRGGYKFEPLPRSREEVQAIASLYTPKSEAFLGEEATEEKAKSLGKGIPLIHLACHAYVNERFPLDSALALTIPEKPREGQDNGLLQAWEIFEDVHIDADLVTLSACESGLGKEMGGEGLIGLTRAFQYAGARSILASLWKVEDRSTAELMKGFYGYLKSGKTKDEALRLAQIDLIRSANFALPFHWAAFQLIGDWR
jgi:CHAT domain-containing protein